MIELVEVVAQWVRTSWTKESRGGMAATRVGSHGSEWWYRLDTLNLAYGRLEADLFLGKPAPQVDECDHLW